MNRDAFEGRLDWLEPFDSPTGLAFVVLIGTMSALGGLAGFVAGLLTAATWHAFGVPYTIAVGHVMVIGLVPDGLGIVSLLVFEGAFLAIVLFDLHWGAKSPSIWNRTRALEVPSQVPRIESVEQFRTLAEHSSVSDVTARWQSAPTRVIAVAAGGYCLLVGAIWTGLRTSSVWLAAGVFLAVFCTVGYGIHRYQRVALALVDEEPSRPVQESETS
ncbi:hypothetical protein OB919_19065 [Halobacteria archaeon AArc-curdl1]|uniref:DUF8163 domain-containing protein n=1 Tax=Natronosalvus hydrolyticus TaxID=2979988 RepID=A0AAP2ZBK4_9EURY|nr:hypothetical protein [Halobacteria archaeon AArc-curdl1]